MHVCGGYKYVHATLVCVVMVLTRGDWELSWWETNHVSPGKSWGRGRKGEGGREGERETEREGEGERERQRERQRERDRERDREKDTEREMGKERDEIIQTIIWHLTKQSHHVYTHTHT